MVSISTKDWTEFVAEVRSRLDVIDATSKANRNDFLDLKQQLVGNDPNSLASRVRSLEDSRTKMSGIQLGLSMAFSIITSILAWILGRSR